MDDLMKDVLDRYLSKFESMIDLQQQQRAWDATRKIFAFEDVPELPFDARSVDAAPDQDWPLYPYNDTFVDRDKMLLDQLRGPFLHNQLRDYHPMNVRSNYGTVILPSVFGLGYQLTETSLPWVHHLPDGDAVRALIDRGIPDIKNGLGGRCFETAAYFRDVLSRYPKLSKAISIYHPDLQGPLDVSHLIWGPDMFYALYDCPEVVHQLLSLVTETYKVWMKAWKAFIGEGNDFTTHWNYYIKGGVMLRDDTAVTLSKAHYEEFVKPYDQALLDEFGGCIHFCGRGMAFIESMCQSRNLYGINMSQPDWNDSPKVLEIAARRRLVVVGLVAEYAPQGARTGFTLLK
jgi:hypothetical protein